MSAAFVETTCFSTSRPFSHGWPSTQPNRHAHNPAAHHLAAHNPVARWCAAELCARRLGCEEGLPCFLDPKTNVTTKETFCASLLVLIKFYLYDWELIK